MIPVEEFLELHPEHRETNEHELMIARINHEHAEREKLEQARQELLKRKQALIAENKKRKDDLANLDQDLEKFIDVRFARELIQACVKDEFANTTSGCQTNSEDLREGILVIILSAELKLAGFGYYIGSAFLVIIPLFCDFLLGTSVHNDTG